MRREALVEAISGTHLEALILQHALDGSVLSGGRQPHRKSRFRRSCTGCTASPWFLRSGRPGPSHGLPLLGRSAMDTAQRVSEAARPAPHTSHSQTRKGRRRMRRRISRRSRSGQLALSGLVPPGGVGDGGHGVGCSALEPQSTKAEIKANVSEAPKR